MMQWIAGLNGVGKPVFLDSNKREVIIQDLSYDLNKNYKL